MEREIAADHKAVAVDIAQLNNLSISRPGDVSGDGNVTMYDAALVARYLAGQGQLSDAQRANAQVTCDGQITQTTATLISQKSLGLIAKFPKESGCP